MPEEEIEIEPENEDYEVVPLSPIRKLERRIQELEEEREVGDTKALVNEVMDLVKSNQQMVNEVVKSNDELRRELSDLSNELRRIPEEVGEITDQWEEFLDILSESSQEDLTAPPGGNPEAVEESMDKVSKKLDQLIDQNERVVDSMKSLKRITRGSGKISGSSGGGKQNRPRVRIKKEEK